MKGGLIIKNRPASRFIEYGILTNVRSTGMRKDNLSQQHLRAVGIVILVLFLGYFAYDYIINEPVARSEKAVLESMMNDIVPPPSVDRLSRQPAIKTQSAYLSETYTTTLSLDHLRDYYAAELQRLGWTYARSTTHNELGANRGQVSVFYCKNSYTATFRYGGPTPPKDWVYAIDLEWSDKGCDPI